MATFKESENKTEIKPKPKVKTKTLSEKSKVVKEKNPSPNPKGNQRKRIAKPHMSKEQTFEMEERLEEKTEHNLSVEKVKDISCELIEIFAQDPTPFFEERAEKVLEMIEDIGVAKREAMELGILTGKKDDISELAYYLTKPLLPVAGIPKKWTPNAIRYINEFYWEKIVLPANRHLKYPPSIHEMLKLANISFTAFNSYYYNGDEEMRNTCEIINDMFVTYLQRMGMLDLLKENTCMFTQKTTYKQKENDQPAMFIQGNVGFVPSDSINSLLKKYGKENISIYDD